MSTNKYAAWNWGDVAQTDISPSWVGGDGIFTEGTNGEGKEVLRRVFTKESRPYASPFDSITVMMKSAGDLGVSPKVLDVDDQTIIMTKLPQSWRRAKLDELRNPYLLWAVLEQHRRVHEIPVETLQGVMQRDLVEEVYGMRDLYRHTGKPLPRDIDSILSRLDHFLKRIDEFHEKPVPCHGDGAASNILIDTHAHPGEVSMPLLTGWTVTDTPEIDFAKYGLWRLVKANNKLALPFGPAAWLETL